MIPKLTLHVHPIISSSLKMNNKCKSISSSKLMTRSVCSLTKPNLNILKKIISKMILMVARPLLIKKNNWQKLSSLLRKSCFSSLRQLILKEIVLSIQLGRF